MFTAAFTIDWRCFVALCKQRCRAPLKSGDPASKLVLFLTFCMPSVGVVSF